LLDGLWLQDDHGLEAERAAELLADGGWLRGADAFAGHPLFETGDGRLLKQDTPGLDHWPQIRRDPGRSGYSRDQVAGPPQIPRWIAGPMFDEVPTIAVGRLLITREKLSFQRGSKNARGPQGLAGRLLIRARRAFNGTLVWQKEVPFFNPEVIKAHPIGEVGTLGNRGDSNGIASHGGQLYIRGERNILVLDLASGAEVRSIPVTGVFWLQPTEHGVVVVDRERAALVDQGIQERWRIDGDLRDPVIADDLLVVMRMSSTAWKRESDDAGLVGIHIPTGDRRFDTALTGLTRPRLRSITSSDEIIVFGERFPLEPFSKPGKGKGNLSVLRTNDLKGASAWESKSLLFGRTSAWRMITEIEGQFFIMGQNLTGGKDPRVRWTGSVTSVNVDCQMASATPNYLILKDHGGLNRALKQIGHPEGFTLGKSICGDQIIPAYGLSFISTQPCDCRGAGHWLRAGVPLAADHPLQEIGYPRPARRKKLPADDTPLWGAGGDPLLGRLRKHQAQADDRGVFPVVSGSVPVQIGPASSGWGQPFADARRSNRAVQPAPISIDSRWQRSDLAQAPAQTPVVGAVSGMVSAGDLLFGALTDEGAIIALDRNTGATRWRWQGSARIVSPPVAHRGLILAGNQAGEVICLRAEDGVECWRTRVAPGPHAMVHHGQLGSLWPVDGPLLVHEGRVHGIAGLFYHWANTPRVFALDLESGEAEWVQVARVNGTALILTERGLQATWESKAKGNWFGNVTQGAFDPETGVFKKFPFKKQDKTKAPIASWRTYGSDGRNRTVTSISLANGSVRMNTEWDKLRGHHLLSIVDKKLTKLLSLESPIAPLGLLSDQHGLVMVCADGSVSAFQ
jgi:hypothetical protein